MIICDDADLDRAASAASMGRFYNCGQACLAIKRVFVFESVADGVIEAIAAKAAKLRLGLGHEPQSQMGPMHSERQLRILQRQLDESVTAGGEVLMGGEASTTRARQRLVLQAHGGARAAAGLADGAGRGVRPVLPVWRVRDFDEAIERANDSPFGLAVGVDRDLDRGSVRQPS
jgi:succinate-semialdehyde dehydrogenase/glutarate-semialdehyde dehydrogenase